jgi:replicative DNA helicase
MEELVRLLVDKPALWNNVDPEHVEDPIDFAIVSIGVELNKRGIVPSVAAISDELKQMENSDLMVKHLHNRMRVQVERDETYVLAMLMRDFNKRHLFSALNAGLQRLRTEEPESVSEFIAERLLKMSSNVPSSSGSTASQDTLKFLQLIYKGETPAIWRTGHVALDGALGLYKEQIVMTAAQQKIGKSRFNVNLCYELHKRQDFLNFIWYTFEMSEAEVVICMIAYLTGIDTKIINGQKRMPTSEERSIIENAAKIVADFPVRFFTKQMDLNQIRRESAKLATGNTVIVLDNLGLVKNSKGLDDLRFENETAAGLVGMRQETGALILPIHHLSKESESHYNKAQLYEPQTKHLRGSNKWADSVNALMLLHRPDHYQQLEELLGAARWKQLQGKMLVNVPISRAGPRGEVSMKYDLSNCRFEETEKS